MKILLSGWLIIILIILSYLQYAYPNKVNPLVGKVWDPVNNFIGGFNPFKQGNQSSTGCPDTISKVCGNNGVTYDNTCKAMEAGITSVTPGECQNGS